jgi:hypothetical protein
VVFVKAQEIDGLFTAEELFDRNDDYQNQRVLSGVYKDISDTREAVVEERGVHRSSNGELRCWGGRRWWRWLLMEEGGGRYRSSSSSVESFDMTEGLWMGVVIGVG